MLRCLIISVIITASISNGNGQLVISEVCSRNHQSYIDATGSTPDFIELLNTSTTPISLEGYFITDDENPYKWELPPIILEGGEYLLILASGLDVTSPELHSNFRINGKGETIKLYHPVTSDFDFVEVPGLHSDHSYGVDSNGNYVYFDIPTPGSINSTTSYSGYAPEPHPNLESGFYSGPIQVSPDNNFEGVTTKYSTGGQPLNETSGTVGASILIDSTMAIQFQSFKEGFLQSDIVTRTYFINEYHSLPVVSIVVPPLYLFDPDTGIYMEGPNASSEWPYEGANFWNNKHVPVTITRFENGIPVIEQGCEMRIHGGKSARTKPQRPLRFIAKKKMGKSYFDYPLIPAVPIFKYKKFVLRNGGSDFDHIRLVDGFIQNHSAQNKIDFDIKASQNVAVYLNGEYWGLMDVQQKIDDHYIRINNDIPDEININIVEDDSIVLFGSNSSFDEMLNYFQNNDLSLTNNFEQASAMLDIPSFTDYMIAETFWNNTDWPANNVKYWKPEITGSKWKYIMFDMDVSMNSVGWVKEHTDNLGRILDDFPENKHVKLLTSLLNNTEYKRYFINRYADLINTSLGPVYLENEFLSLVNICSSEMEQHFGRWGGSMEFWWDFWLTPRAIQFLQKRPQLARDFVQENFNLVGQYDLNLDVWPPMSGTFSLNTIEIPELPWSGVYFNNVIIELEANPSEGYKFSHWETVDVQLTDILSAKIQVNSSSSTKLVAIFKPTSRIDGFQVFPNPGLGNFTLNYYSIEPSVVEILITQPTGEVVWKSKQHLEQGIQKIEITTGLSDGLYLVELINESKRYCQKLVVCR